MLTIEPGERRVDSATETGKSTERDSSGLIQEAFSHSNNGLIEENVRKSRLREKETCVFRKKKSEM